MAPLPLLAALAALVPAVSAPESILMLSTSRGMTMRATTLMCEPAGGMHAHAEDACRALSDVDGQFTGLATGHAFCTLEYDPVTVRASGTWRGETRVFEARFPNPCVMRAETGPVFDF
ncbi:SSI family serine proteinase inhibitor [Saccharothrix isguenensis]